MMKGFFSRPWDLSFKDVLAIAFSSTFLFICVLACFGIASALAVLEVLVPIMLTILGGYFGHEIAAMWLTRNQSYTSGYNNYSGYSNYVTQQTATPTTSAENTNSNLSGEI